MDDPRASSFIDDIWQESIVPTLVDYIRIPNKSPSFDRDWERHGYMEDAVQLVAGWCRDHAPVQLEQQVGGEGRGSLRAG